MYADGSDKVLDIGKVAKESVQREGFIAWQYNTIGVSDAITMGHDGMKLCPSDKAIRR